MLPIKDTWGTFPRVVDDQGINRNADSPVHAMPIAVQQIAGLNQSSRTQQKKSTENRSRSMNQKRLRWKPEEKQMKKGGHR